MVEFCAMVVVTVLDAVLVVFWAGSDDMTELDCVIVAFWDTID